jgi:hypothetical protein
VPVVVVPVVPVVVVPVVPVVVLTVVADTVVVPILRVVPVVRFRADCFSSMARVMDSVLSRNVALALPKLLLSASEQAATT